MIRPYQACDKPNLLHVFKANIPDYFDKTEIHDFENY